MRIGIYVPTTSNHYARAILSFTVRAYKSVAKVI